MSTGIWRIMKLYNKENSSLKNLAIHLRTSIVMLLSSPLCERIFSLCPWITVIWLNYIINYSNFALKDIKKGKIYEIFITRDLGESKNKILLENLKFLWKFLIDGLNSFFMLKKDIERGEKRDIKQNEKIMNNDDSNLKY